MYRYRYIYYLAEKKSYKNTMESCIQFDLKIFYDNKFIKSTIYFLNVYNKRITYNPTKNKDQIEILRYIEHDE